MHLLLSVPPSRLSPLAQRVIEARGHRTERHVGADAGLAALAERVFDAVVIHADHEADVALRALRLMTPHVPTIVLVDSDTPNDRALWLRRGADDCVACPVDPEELEARLHAVVRRQGGAPALLQCEDLVLDLSTLTAKRAGRSLHLSALELRLLRHLLEQKGRIQTRARLLHSVWQLTAEPGTNIVQVYMSYLRAKVDRGFARPLLHTVRGLGYVLEARAQEQRH